MLFEFESESFIFDWLIVVKNIQFSRQILYQHLYAGSIELDLEFERNSAFVVDLKHVKGKKIFLDVEKVFTLADQTFKIIRIEKHVHTDVTLRDRVFDGCFYVSIVKSMFYDVQQLFLVGENVFIVSALILKDFLHMIHRSFVQTHEGLTSVKG
jgi:hypothetical protein